ncbi:hypothetical protein ACNKHL_14965 [Shigella flexneri]
MIKGQAVTLLTGLFITALTPHILDQLPSVRTGYFAALTLKLTAGREEVEHCPFHDISPD